MGTKEEAKRPVVPGDFWMSYREIAEVLGITTADVRNAERSGMRKLRKKFKQRGYQAADFTVN